MINDLGILLCFIDIYSKYAWVVTLEGITITNAFQKVLHESIKWVDKDSEFFNSSVKPWVQYNDIEMHSTHSKGRSVVFERFMGTLKSKINKYMSSISKNVCVSKLCYIFNNYNNTHHSTIKMKPVDVKSRTYIDFDKNNKE